MNERDIRRISARTGLGLKFISKDIFLSNALKAVSERLAEKAILKGGTAISRGDLLDTPRFSEDIDLDLLVPFDTALTDSIMGIKGFNVERPRNQGSCWRFDAYFINHFGEKDRIMIEVSKKDTIDEHEKSILQSPFTSGTAVLMNVYSKNTLFIQKIEAIAGRTDGKDIFDVNGMWMKGLSATIPKELSNRALENLSRMDAKTLGNSTNHYIPRNSRPDWKVMINQVERIIREFAQS